MDGFGVSQLKTKVGLKSWRFFLIEVGLEAEAPPLLVLGGVACEAAAAESL